MTREQLKRWFDKQLPVPSVPGRMKAVTWEDIKRLAQRIEATKEVFEELKVIRDMLEDDTGAGQSRLQELINLEKN